MTATSHALIGTIIAAKIGNPLIAFPLALSSHIVADFIPHWDTATNRGKKGYKKVFIHTLLDVTLGFVVSYAILNAFFPKTDLTYAFFVVIASQLFDWGTSLYYFFNIKSFKWVYEFQKSFNRDLDLPWGLIIQVILIIGLVWFAKAF